MNCSEAIMFVVRNTKDITIEWPLTIEIPVAGGQIKKCEFTGIFDRLPEYELQALIDAVREESKVDSRPHSDAIRLFSLLLKDWKGVQDESGAAIAYSPEQLETMICGVDGGPIAIARWKALGQLRVGAKAKN
jgi:hypothetical protein